MDKKEFKVCDSVNSISRLDWDRVFRDVPEGYAFYKTLEESGLEEFSFFYALLYKNGRLSLIAPIFTADFNLDIAVEGWLKAAIALIRKVYPRFLIIKTLFCGSPFGESGVIGLDLDKEDEPDALGTLIAGLKGFAKSKKARLTIFKDFPQEQAERLRILTGKGFFRLNSFPSAVNELNFHSFEDYLQSLGASSRKSLRRKIRSAYSQAKIEVRLMGEADSAMEDVYRLYLDTHHQGGTKFERLTKEFFISASRNMQPNIKIFLYYVNGRLGAFNLCFLYNDLFIDKFIGFDYDISSRHHLYFVSWCHNIEWCINNGVRFYKTGQTDYCAKLRLGSRLLPLYVYLRHDNRLVNIILKLLSLILKPDNFDTDLRDTRND
jgi:predicted N-acyltransferase